jgi:hypothetical protein
MASDGPGGWRQMTSIPADIPASYGLEGQSVWFLIEASIRGMLVPGERGHAVCYMICEPASHYYKIMTSSDQMPVLIDQRI